MAVIDSAVLRKQPKPECGQILWTIQILHHAAFAIDMCAIVFERLAFPMHSLEKGCCAHVAAVLWYLGYQRHQTGEGFFQRKTIVGPFKTP